MDPINGVCKGRSRRERDVLFISLTTLFRVKDISGSKAIMVFKPAVFYQIYF
jgi:hypothetical protein